MIWVTRARPKTDRIACPWLIRHFIDPDAVIVYAPADQVLTTATEQGGYSFDAPGATYTHQPAPNGQGEWCTFETLIASHHLDDNPALTRLAAIVHAADIDADRDTDPLGPRTARHWHRRPRRRTRRSDPAGAGHLRLRRPLRLVHPPRHRHRGERQLTVPGPPAQVQIPPQRP
jgi:hypothetical protein